jgi:hypothetical protein
MATSKSFLGLVLTSVLLSGGPFAGSLRAEDAKKAEAGRAYPNGAAVVFEWQYSCAGGRACSFTCPGSGGAANNVTKLSMRLMTIPLGATNAAGIFYDYSTVEIPRANGFSIAAGLSTLSCQVLGMTLDYSGSPRQNMAPAAVSEKESPAVTNSVQR